MARRLLLAGVSLQLSLGVSLDTSDRQSILDAAASIADGVFEMYNNADASGAQVGLFPFPPYYWWESGATWGGMVDYWSYTGDDTYLQPTLDALAAQVGPNFDYTPPEQVDNEANDDQAFWVFSILDALEQGFPALPCVGDPNDCSNSYLNMAINVFNEQTARYNNDNTCGGGLTWQYNPALAGTDYKNTVTNGGLMNIAARLAHYTGDSKYADWAEKIWDWEESVRLITASYQVLDGAHTQDNCLSRTLTEWTYNNGIHMHSAAVMYSYTSGSDTWRERIQGLLDTGKDAFFSPYDNATDVLYERACELPLLCTADQTSFKAYLARFWGKTTVLAPFTADTIDPLIEASAKGAAASCDGNGANICGMAWWYGTNDGSMGLGQQLSALEIVQALLVGQATAPQTASGVQRAAPMSVESSAVAAISSIDFSTLSDSILTLPGPPRTATSMTVGLPASSGSILTLPGPTHAAASTTAAIPTSSDSIVTRPGPTNTVVSSASGAASITGSRTVAPTLSSLASSGAVVAGAASSAAAGAGGSAMADAGNSAEALHAFKNVWTYLCVIGLVLCVYV